jgi:hypothetical protein
MAPGEPILTRDDQFDRYQTCKIDHYDPVYGDSATADLAWRAWRVLRQLDPTAPDLSGDAPVWQITRALQEDFVIWAPRQDGQLSAQILSVCMPSGWNPSEKANRSFLEIHEPVPDFDTVNRASDHIARMMTERGPFVRHVWTIANRPGLNRHPSRCEPWRAEGLDDMWFRCERQVTVPVEGRAALFLIRVYMTPLREVLADHDRRRRLISSIMSMTDAVLDYKDLRYVRNWFINRRVD